jgi:membrane associated rhomboid family serine protease
MPPTVLPRRFPSLRMPAVIAALIAATAVVSIAAAIGARNGAPGLVGEGLLVVAAVWQGQLWRLVTWVLFEMDALPLVFACLTLYWFGSDLARAWGGGRFAAAYFGIAAGAAVATCLVGLGWPAVAFIPHGGSWPVLDALVVAWGLLYPQRPLRLYGVVGLTGRQLVWITLAGTVLYALFRGLAGYVPHLAAEGLIFLWLGPMRRLRGARLRQRQESAKAWSFDDWLSRNRRK